MAKDEKDLQGDEEQAGEGGKKKLLIIVGAAVLLLLISAGAAWLLLGDDEASEGEAAEAEAEPLPAPIYHEFDPQFVVNLAPGGRARMLQVKLQVMTRDQAVVDYISRNDPMLRHHLFNLFSSQDASRLYRRDGREDLAKAVEQELESVMKDKGFEGDVEAVYFTELVLQ
jgi:flagellar FliL protein